MIHRVRLSLPYLSSKRWHLVVALVPLEVLLHLNLKLRQ
jgi:hypothetical protein